jgi:hypothetical protein
MLLNFGGKKVKKKIIVSFEVTEEQKEFIVLRAKMQGRTTSNYLRYLVSCDHQAWDNERNEFWKRHADLAKVFEGMTDEKEKSN